MALNFSLFDGPYKQSSKGDAEGDTKPPLKPPPRTCDEWLTSSSGAGHLVSTDGTLFMPSTRDGVIKWPIHPPNLDYLVAAPPLPGQENRVTKTARKHEAPGDTILGSLDEIREDLKQHAPWNPHVWSSVERKVEHLESRLNISADNFVEEEERPTRASLIEGLANISDITFMTELGEELLSMQKQGSIMKSSMDENGSTPGHLRTDLDLSAPSELLRKLTDTKITKSGKTSKMTVCSAGEDDQQDAILSALSEEPLLMSLPGKLDALAILDLVNSAADIPQFLMESWKRVFFCNESVAILQNAFWWIWLDYFKPKKWIQALLFNQIAEDFVSLLYRMEGKNKDQTFMYYPVYLSQALYSAFCQAFPISNKELNMPEFLNYLSSTISEWTLGVQSQPNEWEHWPRDTINPHFSSLHKEKDRREKTKLADYKPCFTDKEVSNLSRHLSLSLSSRLSYSNSFGELDPSKHLDYNKQARKGSSSSSSNLSLTQLEKGPVFECVRFNIHGRSPLLQHYLYHHNITDFKQNPGLTMSRTQIKEFPDRRYTYQQVIRAQRRRAQKLYQEYKSKMAQSERDIVIDRSKQKPTKQGQSSLEPLHQTRKQN